MQVPWCRDGWVTVHDVWHSSQVVLLSNLRCSSGGLLEVVAAVAQIKKVPCIMVAPILCVVIAIVGE
jgi:hypothetical protein